MQRTPPPALAPAAHTKRANFSSGSADFSRAAAHALSPPEEPMWALKMCSLSLHDEPCLLPRRSAPLDAVRPRDALESGDEGPLRLRDEGRRHGAGMGTKRAAAPTRGLEPALRTFHALRRTPSPPVTSPCGLSRCAHFQPTTNPAFSHDEAPGGLHICSIPTHDAAPTRGLEPALQRY